MDVSRATGDEETCYSRTECTSDTSEISAKGTDARDFMEKSGDTFNTVKQQYNSECTTVSMDRKSDSQSSNSFLSMISQSLDDDDEDARRRRRRERNKLAACKCRFKKRQHVAFLVSESERLERHNESLKLSLGEIVSQLEHLSQIFNCHDCHYADLDA